MEKLPTEVLTEIFLRLHVRDFLTISEVCQTFNFVINSSVFLKKITANLTNCGCFEATSRNYVNAKFAHPKNEVLIKFIKTSRMSSSIKELHIEGIQLSSSLLTMDSVKIPQLESFKFFYCSNVILKIFTDCTQKLKTFKLCLLPHEDEHSKNQSYDLVTRILDNNKLTLGKFNSYDVNFDDQFLEKISLIKFRKLFNFSMSFNSCLSRESLGFMNFLKQNSETLEKFKIRTFDYIDQHHLQTLAEYATNLRSLNLIICSFCHYERFSNFKSFNLERLKIRPTNYCDAATTAHSCYKLFIENKVLSHRNENMKFLSIEKITLSIEIIGKIAFAFPNLESLFLPCALNSDASKINLLKNKLKNLKEIVVDCS